MTLGIVTKLLVGMQECSPELANICVCANICMDMYVCGIYVWVYMGVYVWNSHKVVCRHAGMQSGTGWHLCMCKYMYGYV